MSFVVDLIDQDIFKALRGLILQLVDAGTEVVQAQDNLVAMPKMPFVAMNNVGQRRLMTNLDSWASTGAPSSMAIEQHIEYRIQVDFYGNEASVWATMLQALFRDSYGADFFATISPKIQPLYADDPVQIPLITGENQYLQRWRVLAVMQYNPTMNVTQDFADALTVGLVSVDAQFPPS